MNIHQEGTIPRTRGKADIAARALSGPITTDVPASMLQLHPDLIVMLDEGAARQLNRAGVSGAV